MCPIFEYSCDAGHRTEKIRKFADRDVIATCTVCGTDKTKRIEISVPHCMPDGMYSYMPNVGDPAAFERRLHAMKNGERIIKKDAPSDDG